MLSSLVVLVIMTICAVPRMRERHRDLFEATHRFGGWLALALFAVLTVLFAVVLHLPLATTLLLLGGLSCFLTWRKLKGRA